VIKCIIYVQLGACLAQKKTPRI